MGTRRGGGVLHGLLALSSLLLLASGEIIFEERFEGTLTAYIPHYHCPASQLARV
jgi:hypothetical protein